MLSVPGVFALLPFFNCLDLSSNMASSNEVFPEHALQSTIFQPLTPSVFHLFTSVLFPLLFMALFRIHSFI